MSVWMIHNDVSNQNEENVYCSIKHEFILFKGNTDSYAHNREKKQVKIKEGWRYRNSHEHRHWFKHTHKHKHIHLTILNEWNENSDPCSNWTMYEKALKKTPELPIFFIVPASVPFLFSFHYLSFAISHFGACVVYLTATMFFSFFFFFTVIEFSPAFGEILSSFIRSYLKWCLLKLIQSIPWICPCITQCTSTRE